MNRQRKFAIAGVTGAMLVGAGTGVVLNLPSSAGASDSATIATTGSTDSTDTTDATETTTATTDGTAPTPPDAPAIGRTDFLKTALDALVADGTITQAQEDAILAGLKAQLPTLGDGKFPAPGGTGGPRMGGDERGHGGPGFGGPMFGGRGASLDAAATALGITSDELKTELQAGKTIADVATEKGVDVQTVIDAIVAAETASITDRVTDMVNGVRPEKPSDPSTDSSTDSSTTTPTTGG